MPDTAARGQRAAMRRRPSTLSRTYAGPPHNIAGRAAVSADHVARVITRAAISGRPRARYPVAVLARGLFLLRRWLPPAAFDAFVRTQFPIPHPQAGPRPVPPPQRART